MIGNIVGDYRIESILGEGGMGIVYLAKHKQISQLAAIKMLKTEYINNEEIVNRFVTEAETMTRFSHENIIRIFNFSKNELGPYVIMEYFEGTPLDEYLTNKVGLLDESIAIPLIKQILKAYEYVHKKGIVHRDIKPSNILYDVENQQIKLLDFGISKDLHKTSSLTKTGTQMGTVFYMSPEQVEGKAVDIRSDIYSLGVTFYQILTGVNPYAHCVTDYEVYSCIVKEDLPDPRNHYPNISERMVNILNKALSKNPLDRFQTCKDFLDVIENASLQINNKLIDKKDSSITKNVKDNYVHLSLFVLGTFLAISPSNVLIDINLFYLNVTGLILLSVLLYINRHSEIFKYRTLTVSSIIVGLFVTIFSFSIMDRDKDGFHDYFDSCPDKYQIKRESCS